jgi:hypothetical protein
MQQVNMLNIAEVTANLTTDVGSSNLDPCEMQKHYVIQFVSDLRHLDCLLRFFWFPW